MPEKPEDYQTTLTEEQKNILDDAPPKVVGHLLEHVKKYGNMPMFRLKVTDKVTGHTKGFIEFEGPASVNAIDYLKYLIRNGYKHVV